MTDFVAQHASCCLHCKKPQCVSGCPIAYDIPRFLQLANSGDLSASEVCGHLFGEVCGYVCPREVQCAGNCILGNKGTPVDVGLVERQVFAQHFPTLKQTDEALSHLKVAVVGGGVSGVTFAEQCYRHGATVTVFEANQLLHTLRSIPTFRLPSQSLQRIVDAVSGKITVETRRVTHQDLIQLQKQFDVVYLSTGAALPNKMYAEGESEAITADTFLRGNFCGTTVVVGGGNTAIDCARKAALGGKAIVAYRRTRQDMPAFPKEIAAAESEGVQFLFNLAPVKVQRSGNLILTFAQTQSEGRGKLTVTDKLFTLTCDQVVVATGSKFDTSVYPAEKFVAVDSNNRVQGNLFAGGDAIGNSLVVQAVRDALNAAKAVLATYKR